MRTSSRTTWKRRSSCWLRPSKLLSSHWHDIVQECSLRYFCRSKNSSRWTIISAGSLMECPSPSSKACHFTSWVKCSNFYSGIRNPEEERSRSENIDNIKEYLLCNISFTAKVPSSLSVRIWPFQGRGRGSIPRRGRHFSSGPYRQYKKFYDTNNI